MAGILLRSGEFIRRRMLLMRSGDEVFVSRVSGQPSKGHVVHPAHSRGQLSRRILDLLSPLQGAVPAIIHFGGEVLSRLRLIIDDDAARRI